MSMSEILPVKVEAKVFEDRDWEFLVLARALEAYIYKRASI